MAIPSLAMIPSGYKDGKVYSVLPSNGDGDFTFSRGSNATRVNKDGLIETMPLELGEELVTNGGFATDSDWTKGASWSIGGGVATYDDSANAAIQSSAISLSTSKSYVLSFTVSNGSGARLQFTNQAAQALYDLYSLGNLDNGNHSITFNPSYTSTSIRLYGYTVSGGSFDLDNVSIKEIISGLDTPRLDYSDSSCPSLLLEPQRTNLITQSELFSDASWGKTATIVGANSIISADGTQNAYLIQSTQTATAYVAPNNLTLTIGNTYTFSCFAKKGNNDWIRLAHITSGGTGCWFDLENGVVGTVNSQSATIEYYGNGWYRCTNTFIAIDDTDLDNAFIGICDANGSTNAGIVGKNDYLWGAQLEEGSYATSYIPTNGASATRLEDVCNSAGTSDTFNDSEGVLMAEISAFDFVTNSKAISIYKTSSPSSNAVILYYNGNRIAFDILNPSGNVSVPTNISNAKELNKVAIKYKSGDIALWFNGVELVTRTNTLSLSGLDKLEFDFVSNNDFYGNTKQIQYYNTALTDSEIEELTSWESFILMANGQNYTIK